MDPTVLMIVVAIGIGAAGLGVLLMRSAGGTKEPLVRPPEVEQTDPHGRQRIIDRWVYLALELSRVDGAIGETEIAAIEKALVEGAASVPQEEAQRIVHQALRATIRQAQIGAALDEIGKHADATYRRWVMDELLAVAAADGEINRDEELFLDRVRSELGLG